MLSIVVPAGVAILPKAGRRSQHQFPNVNGPDRGHFGGYHSSRIVPDDMRRIQPQGIYEVSVVKRELKDVLNVVNVAVAFKTGMRRRIYSEAVRKAVQKLRPLGVAERPVKVEKRMP